MKIPQLFLRVFKTTNSFKRVFSIAVLIQVLFCLLINFSYAQSGANDPSFHSGDQGFGFGDGVLSGVSATCVQADGKIIIGGGFSTYNQTPRLGIARLNTDGTLDASFNSNLTVGVDGGSYVYINSISLLANGQIIVGGNFTGANGAANIARLNSDGTVDATFNAGTGANQNVYTTFVQPNGKIIVGGNFTSFNGGTSSNHITRLNADGTLDATFTGKGMNYSVQTIKLQSDGKILIGGNFDRYNYAVTRSYVARLNADGTLDTGYHPIGAGPDAEVKTISIQTDGKIVIGGNFTSFDGTPRNGIARLNTNGTLDGSFNPVTDNTSRVFTTSIQADGKIIIGGGIIFPATTTINYIARLNSDGTKDVGFDSKGPNDWVYTSTLQSDGKIIIGETLYSSNGIAKNTALRLNSDGTRDVNFNSGTGFNGWVMATQIQSDGKVIIGGEFTQYDSKSRSRIARLDANGTLDQTFDPGTGFNQFGTVQTISILSGSSGKILIGGAFTSYNGVSQNYITCLNSDGTLDASFKSGTGVDSYVNRSIVQPDGKIIIAGSFNIYNGITRNYIARLNPDGTLDTGFDPGVGASSSISALALQPDGKIVVGGRFTSYNGVLRKYIARLNSNGTLDLNFDPGVGPNGWPSNIQLQADGKILVGGDFTTFANIQRAGITRLNSDGTIDASFNPGAGVKVNFNPVIGATQNGVVAAICAQSDGKIIIGGWFNTFNEVPNNYITRLNNDGSLDASFNVGSGTNQYGAVNTINLQSDGKIIIGGRFISYNSIGRNRIARLLNCINTFGTDIHVACQSYKWIDGKTYTENNNTATYVLKNARGCDSTVTLNLTIHPFPNKPLVSMLGNTVTSSISNGTYQWINCNSNNSPIVGATNRNYTLNNNGSYAVEITENSCVNTSLCIEVTTTEIDKSDFVYQLDLFPNPTTGEINILVKDASTDVMVKIIGVDGQEVDTKAFHNQKMLKLFIDAKPGMYYLYLSNEKDEQAVLKVIKN
jgi:hypothetical protein